MHVLHEGLRRNALREQLLVLIPQAQRVADPMHLQLAFLPWWDFKLQKIPWSSNDALTNRASLGG